MPSALLDTNVFIFSIEHPESNSNIIVEMAVDGEVEVVISEEIRLELIEYLRSEYGKDAAYHADSFLKTLPAEVIEQKRIINHLSEFKGKIKEYIVTYDRDFKRTKTTIPVLTPREFVEKLGIEAFDSDY